MSAAAVADQVDDDVAVERLAVGEGELATRATASGSSPFTWKIGAWIVFATSVEYTEVRADSGGVVNPTGC